MAGPGLYRYWSNKVSPAHGLYLARAVKILSPLTAGCESTLHEKEPASGYNWCNVVVRGSDSQP